MSDDKFSLDRLLKLLGMTSSSSDGEALAAIRMANKEISRLGKTWEDILRGKITIVEDPFNTLKPAPHMAKPAPPPPPTPRQAPNYGSYTSPLRAKATPPKSTWQHAPSQPVQAQAPKAPMPTRRSKPGKRTLDSLLGDL